MHQQSRSVSVNKDYHCFMEMQAHVYIWIGTALLEAFHVVSCDCPIMLHTT